MDLVLDPDPGDFDPREQVLIMLAADGVTEIPIPVPIIDVIYRQNAKVCITYGVGVGASILMLLVLIGTASRPSHIKLTHWVHMLALVVNIVRTVLAAVYCTSEWLEFYAFFAVDYSYLEPTNYQQSAAAEVMSLFFLFLIQLMLGLQAWAMVRLMPGLWKWCVVVFSATVSLSAVSLRFAAAVYKVHDIMAATESDITWQKDATLMSTATIFYYCVLFNSKLVTHLVQHRGHLPSRRGLTSIEVLVITNGLLMFIPMLFAGLAFGQWEGFESASFSLTSVALFLPLGTLVAQRLASQGPYYDSAGSDKSGGPGHGHGHYQPRGGLAAAKILSTTTTDSSIVKSYLSDGNLSPLSTTHNDSTIMSRIEASHQHSAAAGSSSACNPIDVELRQIDNDDIDSAEKGQVVVGRALGHDEQRP